MFLDYFSQVKSAYTRPSRFLDQNLGRADLGRALRFAAITGACVALELGISEALTSSSLSIVALVTVLALILLPIVFGAWVFIWSGFIRLCAFLLQENLPASPLRLVVGYSSVGLLFLGLDGWIGKLISLITVVFQVWGMERVLRCSRWTAILFVFLPFSIFLLLLGLVSLMFKVF
ncbi:MAG: hypothetical protein ACREL1_05470 [bacterium]